MSSASFVTLAVLVPLMNGRTPRGRGGLFHTGAKAGLKEHWSLPVDELFRQLHATPLGLASSDAARRLAEHGPNELRDQHALSRARVLWNQLRNPLLLLLLFAAGTSAITGQWIDAVDEAADVAKEAADFAIPFLPKAELLGFTPVPPAVLATLVGITAVYVLTVELAKTRFYRRLEVRPRRRAEVWS